MVVVIPEGIYKMNEKRKIVKENVMNYRRSRKKEKVKILDELEEVIGYSRKYLIKLLNLEGKKVRVKEGVYVKGDLLKSGVHERGRKKKYPEELKKYLIKIWKLSGQVSSKHLRLLESPDVSEEKKKELKEKKKNLSLYQLNREIKNLLQKLNNAWIKKQRKGKRYGGIDISLVGGGE